MIFKKIGNMENVEAICHYLLMYDTEVFGMEDKNVAVVLAKPLSTYCKFFNNIFGFFLHYFEVAFNQFQLFRIIKV